MLFRSDNISRKGKSLAWYVPRLISLLILFMVFSICIHSNLPYLNASITPSIKVIREKLRVDGRDIPILKAEINLKNPSVIFDIVTEVEVNREGGFSNFSKFSKAAFLANTTFKHPNSKPEVCDRKSKDFNPINWTTVSQGNIIRGICSQNWSNGTVLGIRDNNNPEMIKRSSSVPWKMYWFAITSCPRLLENGKLSKDSECKSPGKAQRSAIGFSKASGSLYHVITDEQNGSVTYDELAKIMQRIGADEAMGLEGGNGVLMADSSQVYVDDASDNREAVRAPVVIVYDAINPPHDSLLHTWKHFQSQLSPK